MATVPTPYLESVYDITAQDIVDNADFFAWLNERLGDMITDIFSPAGLSESTKKIAVDVPRVKNSELPALEYFNDTDAIDSPFFDEFAFSSSAHVIAGETALVAADFLFPASHGYADAKTVFLAGVVPSHFERWRWVRVDEAIDLSSDFKGFAVLGANEAFRDGFFWFSYGGAGGSGFVCGGCI